jgi:DNA-binding NarL/FixJ family response regulator
LNLLFIGYSLYSEIMLSGHKIRVLLVDDHTVVREGLKVLISTSASLEVVGEAKDGRQAVIMSEALRPDIVIMDVSMPGMNGEAATRKIIRHHPETKVIVLSTYRDEQLVNRLLQAGAASYISKSAAASFLIAAIEQIYRGEKVMGPAVAHHGLGEKKLSVTGDTRKGKALTRREAEVLQLIAEGNSNKEMANLLNVSIKTIEKHREAVMEKLDLHDTAGLTRYAIAHGIVDVPRS